MIDSRRAHNVGIKAYTHYSFPHDCYARLDYIFCTPILLANSSNAHIHTCPWSDHQIISFDTSHIGLAPTPFSWRLNDSLLTDPSITQQITKHIEEYFSHNSTEEIPPSSLWSAHKAVLRGHLINIASVKNKTRLSDIKRLTKDLYSLYNTISQTPSQDLTRQIQTKRQELDLILSTNIEKSLRFSKAKYILHSNSTTTMFARKLNQGQKPPHVYKLRDHRENLVTHPQEVLDIFSNFYKNLLSGPQTHPSTFSLNWLDGLQLPLLSSQQIATLN